LIAKEGLLCQEGGSDAFPDGSEEVAMGKSLISEGAVE